MSSKCIYCEEPIDSSDSDDLISTADGLAHLECHEALFGDFLNDSADPEELDFSVDRGDQVYVEDEGDYGC